MRKTHKPTARRHVLLALPALWLAAALPAPASAADAPQTLLNVSYDVSREFYKQFNAAFMAHWKKIKR